MTPAGSAHDAAPVTRRGSREETIDVDRPEDHRRRAHRVPERLHLRGRRAPRRRRARSWTRPTCSRTPSGSSTRPGSRRDGHARADHVRRGLQRDQLAPVRHPQGRRRRQRVRQGHLGRRHRRRARARPRATSSSRASAASTRSRAPTSTSSCAARASRRSCSAASSPTAASSRRCAAGYENGYKVITLSDCVAATSLEEHDNALEVRLPDVLRADDARRSSSRPSTDVRLAKRGAARAGALPECALRTGSLAARGLTPHHAG